MLLAIEEMVKQGVSHNDIKPANILVSSEGNILLGDFGIAAEAKDLLGEKKVRGTMATRAPEGEYEVGKSDLYSLAQTMAILISTCHFRCHSLRFFYFTSLYLRH